MAKVLVMHFLNQFFAGIGGEDKADVPVGSSEGGSWSRQTAPSLTRGLGINFNCLEVIKDEIGRIGIDMPKQ